MSKTKFHVLIAAGCAIVWGLICGATIHPVVGLASGILAFFVGMYILYINRIGGKR